MRAQATLTKTVERTIRGLLRKGSEATRPMATPLSSPVSPCGDLRLRTARRAYELFEHRGSRHGRDLDDWLQAEQEILMQA